MGRKLGVVVVGVNGAVSSTLIAGCRLMAKGIVPRVGMITEKGNPAPGRQVTDYLEFAAIEDMVFAGWDVQSGNLYEAAKHHGKCKRQQSGHALTERREQCREFVARVSVAPAPDGMECEDHR